MLDPEVFFYDKEGFTHKIVGIVSPYERRKALTWSNFLAGVYNAKSKEIYVMIENRTIASICRTITHEYLHHIMVEFFDLKVTKQLDGAINLCPNITGI